MDGCNVIENRTWDCGGVELPFGDVVVRVRAEHLPFKEWNHMRAPGMKPNGKGCEADGGHTEVMHGG